MKKRGKRASVSRGRRVDGRGLTDEADKGSCSIEFRGRELWQEGG